MAAPTTTEQRERRRLGRPPRRLAAARQRIEIRVPAEFKERLLDAAALSGRSLSDFVIAAAEQAANETIQEHRLTKLSQEESLAVARLLLDPPAPTDALIEATRRWQEWQERLAAEAAIGGSPGG